MLGSFFFLWKCNGTKALSTHLDFIGFLVMSKWGSLGML